MEWLASPFQHIGELDLWGIKSTGTRSKEMEEVDVGVLISCQTSIMKKAPREEEETAEAQTD